MKTTKTRAAVIPSYMIFSLAERASHKKWALLTRDVVLENGRELSSSQCEIIDESDSPKELYQKAIKIDDFSPCPNRISHHAGATCKTCGLAG